MKPLTAWILVSSLVLPCLADDHAPPPAAKAEAAQDQPVPPAFLGVGTAAIPEILLEHLDLKPGEGVMIESIQEEGPATKAGIKVGDIITRFAGKPVESTIDLGEKIRAQKPGDTIRIDVIHKGKPLAIDVTLAERPADLLGPEMLDLLANPGAAKLQDRVQDLQLRLQGMQLQMGNLARGNPMFGGGINLNGGGEIRLRDNEGSVGYKTDGDSTEITVRDHHEKVVWSGPWDSEQDKAAAPEDIRVRIERFNIRPNVQGNGIQLRMNGHEDFVLPEEENAPEAGEVGEEEP